MKPFSFACALFLLLALQLPAAPALKRNRTENLLVNGSFEKCPEFKVHLPLNADSKDITGWIVTRGQIDVCEEQSGGVWKAADGKNSLDLHGSPGLGGVKQSFATTAGQKYRVTFMMSGNPGVAYADGKAKLAVEAAGQTKEFECDMAGKSQEDLKWEKRSWEFTAKDKATTLEIRTAMPAGSNAFGGPAIDDVKVVEAD